MDQEELEPDPEEFETKVKLKNIEGKILKSHHKTNEILKKNYGQEGNEEEIQFIDNETEPEENAFPVEVTEAKPKGKTKRNPEEPLKGILKHQRTYSDKHVDFDNHVEYVPFDETKDFTIEIQIVKELPKKVVSYAALIAKKKEEDAEQARSEKKEEEKKRRKKRRKKKEKQHGDKEKDKHEESEGPSSTEEENETESTIESNENEIQIPGVSTNSEKEEKLEKYEESPTGKETEVKESNQNCEANKLKNISKHMEETDAIGIQKLEINLSRSEDEEKNKLEKPEEFNIQGENREEKEPQNLKNELINDSAQINEIKLQVIDTNSPRDGDQEERELEKPIEHPPEREDEEIDKNLVKDEMTNISEKMTIVVEQSDKNSSGNEREKHEEANPSKNEINPSLEINEPINIPEQQKESNLIEIQESKYFTRKDCEKLSSNNEQENSDKESGNSLSQKKEEKQTHFLNEIVKTKVNETTTPEDKMKNLKEPFENKKVGENGDNKKIQAPDKSNKTEQEVIHKKDIRESDMHCSI